MKKIVSIAIFTVLVFVGYVLINHMNDQIRVKSDTEIDFTNNPFITKIDVPPYVKRYDWTKEGQMKITEVFIPVKKVMQLPELPHGCEITSLTSILNFYGYEVSKTVMADKYLPKQPFAYKNKKRYGANPYKAYAGNPRSKAGGFFSYAPPIKAAADKYLEGTGESVQVIDISGSTREEIMGYINKGIPVLTWVTLSLEKPRMAYTWYFHGTKEKFTAPVNLHAVVLNGFDGNKVHVMNPLKGQMTYGADAFFKSYKDLGSHALVVVKEK